MSETIAIWINDQPCTLPASATLADAVQQAHIAPPFAAAVNLQFVPRSQYTQRALAQGDKIELISPITGG
jgi:sulfur carrier protein